MDVLKGYLDSTYNKIKMEPFILIYNTYLHKSTLKLLSPFLHHPYSYIAELLRFANCISYLNELT